MHKLTEKTIKKILAKLVQRIGNGKLLDVIAAIMLQHNSVIDKYHELEAENLLLKTEINMLKGLENQL